MLNSLSKRLTSSQILVAILLSIFTYFLIAELDYGVHSQGIIVNDNRTLSIQSYINARVESISVKEGQQVSKGDVLLKLKNPDLDFQSRSNYKEFVDGITSTINAYMIIGYDKRKIINLLENALELERRPEISEIINQSYIKALRLNTLRNHQIKTLKESLEANKTSQLIHRYKVEALQDLVNQGLVSRAEQDQQKVMLNSTLQDFSQIESRLIELEGSQINEARSIIEDFPSRKEYYLSKYQAYIEAQKNLVIRAADDGQIIGVSVSGHDEVVAPGQKLMRLVSSQSVFVVESSILQPNINKVAEGMPAEIVFTSLSKKTTPMVEGRVRTISSDLVYSQAADIPPNYKLIIDFNEVPEEKLGEKIILGMPVDVLIKGGSRSMMSYFVTPIKLFMSKAMREK